MEARPSFEHPLSWKAIARVIIAGLAVFLVWRLQGIILMIIVALMVAAALYPIVAFLNKRLPIILAAGLVVIFIFLPLLIIAFLFLSTFITEFPSITRNIDKLTHQATILPPQIRNIDITQYAQDIGSYFLRTTTILANFLTFTFTVIFLSLYFLIDYKNLHSLIINNVPSNKRNPVDQLIKRVALICGSYIRGNLFISVICATIISIGLTLLGMPYAILLGIFAGLFDLLPNIGAFVAAIPAVIIGFSISPLTGILVIALFALYQQFENNVISPNVYNRILEVSPTISFLSVIIGSALFGAIGAFIALPIAASVPTVLQFLNKKAIK